MLTNTGSVSERYTYDAFGNPIGFTPSSTTKTTLLYSGEMLDTTTGWYYLRQRYYDPKTGRFNRLDPFWGNASDPQSLHKYTYCHGDPVNHIDPSGEFLAVSIQTVGIGAGIGAAFGGYHGGIQGAFIGALAGGVSGAAVALASPALAAYFGAGFWGTIGFGATTGAIGGFIHGGIYGTFIQDRQIGFDLKNGLGLALIEGGTGAIFGGVFALAGKLCFGMTPRPTGTHSKELKKSMIDLAETSWFRFRAECWSRLTGRGRINWDAFMERLKNAEYLETQGSILETGGGWAGLNQGGDKWLFAIPRTAGSQTKAHELIHAVQDAQTELFSKGALGPFASAAYESSAHFYGNYATGIPVATALTGSLFWFMDMLIDAGEMRWKIYTSE